MDQLGLTIDANMALHGKVPFVAFLRLVHLPVALAIFVLDRGWRINDGRIHNRAGTEWILNTGAQWHMLPQSYPNYKTVHRRFQQWCRTTVPRDVLTDLANALREQGQIDEEECFIDAMFSSAKGGGQEIGPARRGKGVKIIGIVDRHGLALAVSTHAANHHEVTLVQLSFDFYMIEAKSENLIGDRAYDSDKLDQELEKDGVRMIAPHKSNRKKPRTQDGRRLRRYPFGHLKLRFEVRRIEFEICP